MEAVEAVQPVTATIHSSSKRTPTRIDSITPEDYLKTCRLQDHSPSLGTVPEPSRARSGPLQATPRLDET